AAPAFVRLATGGAAEQPLRIGDGRYVVRPFDPTRTLEHVVTLADPDGTLFPDAAEAGSLVLARDDRTGSLRARVGLVRRVTGSDAAGILRTLAHDRRLRGLLLAMLVLTIVNCVVMMAGFGRDLPDALLITVSAISLSGFGDVDLIHAST